MTSSMSSTTSGREGGGDGEEPGVELRASVLDAALSLGFRSSVMKKWMFDAVPEGEDDETTEHSTPALTSPSTSEESSLSPYSFRQPAQSSYPYLQQGTTNSSNSASGGTGKSTPGLGSVDPLYTSPNNLSTVPFHHEDGMNSPNGTHKGPLGMLALAVPPTKNKLRKQKNAFVLGGGATGYESDGGYLSEVTKKGKSRMGLGWRKKDRSGDGGDDGGDSDGGYRSEAASSLALAKAKTKAKKKGREKEEATLKPIDAATPSPRLPSMSMDEDPGAFLATVKASVLHNNSKPGSGSGSTPEPTGPPYGPGPSSSSGHGHGFITTTTTTAFDGYFTDSEKRGRTKKKSKSKTRSDSPITVEDGDEPSSTRTPKKKKSLFRLMGRSASRDAKDRDRSKTGEGETPPPLPEPPRPPVPLPIADRFARSGAGTPVGNAPATLPSSISDPNSSKLGVGEGLGTGLTKSASSMDLPIYSSGGSLNTLVPPTFRDPDHLRSESPWSYRSAPGRIGTSGEYERDGSGSNSLELPRERKNNGGWSPFVVIPRSSQTDRNGDEGNGGDSGVGERPESPFRSKSPSPVNAPGSPESGKSPTTRIGKFFNAFGGQSSKSDDGHYSGGSSSSHPPTSFTSTTASSSSSSSSASSKPSISHPNPHLGRRGSLSKKFPNPLDIAAALTHSVRGGGANGNANGSADVNANGMNLAVNTTEGVRPITPESFMIIDQDDGLPTPIRQQRFAEANVNASDPSSLSSQYLSVSAAYTNGIVNGNGGSSSPAGPSSPRPSSPLTPNGSTSGFSTRRRALLNGLGLDITPTQSRSGTPTPINTNISSNGDPTEGEVKAARASVLAYYQVPPPSPPPTGPLPAPPPPSSPSTLNARPVSPSPRQEPGVVRNSSQISMLSPGRAYASRSPSPLSAGVGVGAGFNNGLSVRESARFSRCPSPGLGAGQGQGVRRGRESPFPTRPILPPQNRQGLVERVERYKAMYATTPGSDERLEDGMGMDYETENGNGNGNGWERRSNENEAVDRHSSAYIREARARGEKRVYFDTRRYSIKAESYTDYGDDVYQDGDNAEAGYGYGYGYVDEDAETNVNGYTPTLRNVAGTVGGVGVGVEDDVDPVMPIPIPEIEVNPVDTKLDSDDISSHYEDDFDEESDERLRFSKLKDEFEDGEDLSNTVIDKDANGNMNPNLTANPDEDESSSTDRRSYAASSVYSQYSVLDADKSAKAREGLVRRVAALYNGRGGSGSGNGGGGDEGRLLKEEIPEVPRIPKELRGINGNGRVGEGTGGGGAAGQLKQPIIGRGDLRMTSSRYRF